MTTSQMFELDEKIRGMMDYIHADGDMGLFRVWMHLKEGQEALEEKIRRKLGND